MSYYHRVLLARRFRQRRRLVGEQRVAPGHQHGRLADRDSSVVRDVQDDGAPVVLGGLLILHAAAAVSVARLRAGGGDVSRKK